MIEWVKYVDLVVTVDTGTCHIATTVGTKQIVFYQKQHLFFQYFLPAYGWSRILAIPEDESIDTEQLGTFLKLAI